VKNLIGVIRKPLEVEVKLLGYQKKLQDYQIQLRMA
jgi:hypothetical protein